LTEARAESNQNIRSVDHVWLFEILEATTDSARILEEIRETKAPKSTSRVVRGMP
jgi:hypothetical protein